MTQPRIIDSRTLEVDRDVHEYLSLIDGIGVVHWGDLIITSYKDFVKYAKDIDPNVDQNKLRFSVFYSDITEDNKKTTSVLHRGHIFNLRTYLGISRNNQQDSYLERRAITQRVLDHISSVNRYGKHIDIIEPASVNVEKDEFNGNLVYILTFEFVVIESVWR